MRREQNEASGRMQLVVRLWNTDHSVHDIARDLGIKVTTVKTYLTRFNARHRPVTPQEARILNWVSLGFTNGQIGTKMGLSEDTVKSYMTRLFRKLGAKDRAHLVRRGVEEGTLTFPSVLIMKIAPTPPLSVDLPTETKGGT